ncbi:hypothetical protein [Antarctobacter heliothermus]|uniref:Precorrin-3B synthase n=1 Tax=Antarctobacter heliothermus TaxID=74033 RepID=A0A239IP11_9RHOB|nr:hypothetical protein [Antarctobacter heliothermus]SNS94958.1 precorrin-3B synthase [Antarctobacter heliothermus]
MSAPLVKGWCPGAFRPMMSGDGLVVRVRPPLGEVSATQAAGLADLAERHGSGVIEATARANLQLRGVSESAYPALIQDLRALGLLGDADSEARRNLVLDPFRAPKTDQIARGFLDGLSRTEFSALPGKFGFVVDPGTPRRLAGISGDIRIESSAEGMILRADGCATGRLLGDTDEAIALGLNLARWFLTSGGVGADGRGRMARHLDGGTALPDALSGDVDPSPAAPEPQPGRQGHGVCVAAAFGQFTSGALRALSETGGPIRVTPYRMLYLPAVTDLPDHPDLILDPQDALRRVQACTGAPGCPQATVQTRDLARRLALSVPEGQCWHVSGCAKGCAYPRFADLTLVGRDGAFDLVKQGTPWDDPIRRGLSPLEIDTEIRS